MTRMIADRKLEYRSVTVSAGEEFDVDDQHVELFQKIEYAHLPEKQTYSTRDMAARRLNGRRRATR